LVRVATDATEPAFDARDLAAGLDQLDDELREVVVAKIWGGLGFAEIAEMLGQSPSTAYRRFQNGLSALRRILEGPCETNPSMIADHRKKTI
jgi:RNA polymerase sigma-70 factor (ECF subfamily)